MTTGLPFNSGFLFSSTEAKKASMSICRIRLPKDLCWAMAFLLHFLILQEDSTASGMEKFYYGRSFPGILYILHFLVP
jgi:hypothetical protein